MPWAPDYATTADLKSYLRITGAADDVQLQLAVTSASRAIDSTARRQFGQVAALEARSYTARFDATLGSLGLWVVPIDDLMDAAGLTVAVAAGSITLYALNPANAAQRSRPWNRVVISKDSLILPKGETNAVTVTAKWGWTAVPDTVKQATLIQASRFFKRRDAPFGIAGSPDTGSELRLLAKADPDVAFMLKPYTRWDKARRTVG